MKCTTVYIEKVAKRRGKRFFCSTCIQLTCKCWPMIWWWSQIGYKLSRAWIIAPQKRANTISICLRRRFSPNILALNPTLHWIWFGYFVSLCAVDAFVHFPLRPQYWIGKYSTCTIATTHTHIHAGRKTLHGNPLQINVWGKRRVCSDLQTAGDCTHTRMKIDKLHKDIAEASRRNRKSLIWYSLCMWVGMLLHMIIVCRGAHGKHNHIQIIIRICLTAQVGGFGARHIGLAESYLECAIRAHALACSANIATALFLLLRLHACLHVSPASLALILRSCTARSVQYVCSPPLRRPSDGVACHFACM